MWELPTDMHSYIAPSIVAYAETQPDPLHWLEVTLQEQRDEDAELIQVPLGMDGLANLIAENAIKYGGTTNGGHQVYLHAWESIPWCNEDAYLTWYS